MPSNTEAEGARVIGICQNPEGPQPWFQADSTDEKCPEPYCDCEPKFYVALRSTPEAEALIERLTAVADLLIQMESWNVSHGPLDDPTIGNLIVSARNVIGDPRDLRSTPEAGEGRQVSAEDLARLRRLLNHWDERTPKRTLHGESLARILDALEPAAATTPTSPSRTVTPPSWPATTPPERKGDDD